MLIEAPGKKQSIQNGGPNGNGRAGAEGERNRAEDDRNRELVRRWLAGDESGFAELYELYAGKIYNFCLRLTNNPEDAAEATQEGFWGFLDSLKGIDLDKVLVSSYLFAAARNAAIRNQRKMRRVTPTGDVPEGNGDRKVDLEIDPERSALLVNQRSAVARANRRIPERQRAALALRELEGMSYTEIGRAIGIRENAVAQLISRARIRLRAEIRDQTVSLPPKGSDCARSLPLLSRRVDSSLAGDDEAWLDTHLSECEACRANLAEIEEAGATYRSWLPVPVALAFKPVGDAGGAQAGQIQFDGYPLWSVKTFTRKSALIALTAATATLTGAVLLAGISSETNRPVANTAYGPTAVSPEPSSAHATSRQVAFAGMAEAQSREGKDAGRSGPEELMGEFPASRDSSSAKPRKRGESSGTSGGKRTGNNRSGNKDKPSPTESGGKGSNESSPSPIANPSAPITPQPTPTSPPAGGEGTGGGDASHGPAGPEEPCDPSHYVPGCP